MAKLILEQVLKKKRITKYEFAKRLGIDYKNVFRLFHKDTDPRLSALIKYAQAIGCKVRDLIKE